MADPTYSPWTPGPAPENMLPDQGVAQQIGSFMDDPRARSALLSFGLSLMQPPSFGDNPVAQIGRAVGAGGEAAGRVQNQALKEQELASKEDLRAAQGDASVARAAAAEARAGTAGARLDTASANLGLRQQALNDAMSRANLTARIRLSNMYQKYVQDVTERNNDITRPKGSAPEQILPMDQWVQANPALKTLGLIPKDLTAEPGTESDTGLPPPVAPVTPTTKPTTLSPSDYPLAPTNPKDRQINKSYRNSNGQIGVWMGNGWLLQ